MRHSTEVTNRRLSDVTSSSFRLLDDDSEKPTKWKINYVEDYDDPQRSVFVKRLSKTQNRPILGLAGDKYYQENSLFPGEYGIVKVNRPVYSQNNFNELHEENVTEGQTMRFLDNVFMPRKEKRNCLDVLLSIFPLISVIRNYKVKQYLPFDFLSGLTTGVMRIPQSMAYGLLTTLSPEYGLYTAFFSAILYPIFGGSPHMVAGAQGVVSLIIGQGVSKYASKTTHNLTNSSGSDNSITISGNEVEVAITITFMIGIIQCLLGICRFGFVTNYLSDPLIGGFTTAAAVTVVVSQLPVMLGFEIASHHGTLNLWYSLIDIFSNISRTNYVTVLITIFCMTFLIICKVLTNRFIKRIKVPIPGELLIMIAMIVFSYLLQIDKRWNIKWVGFIKQGFPTITPPNPKLMLKTLDVSISGAIISFAIAYSVAKKIAVEHDYNINSNREVFALGFINSVGSFFNIFAVTASMSASSLHDSLGGVSQIANLIASILVLLTFMFFGKQIEPIPECVLSTVILINLKSILFQFFDLKKLWKVSKFDFLLWIVSFSAVVIADIQNGLLIGVAFSLLTIVFRTQWPYSCLLGRIPSTDIYKNIAITPDAVEIPGIKIFRFEGSLYFASADHFREAIKHITGINPSKIVKEQMEMDRKLLEIKEHATQFLIQNDEPGSSEQFIEHNIINFNDDKVHHLIIDLSTCGFIDSVGIRILLQVIKDYNTAQIKIFLANVKSAVRAMFIDSQVMYKHISPRHMFLSVHDAVLGALEDANFIEERNCLMKDATMKSRIRVITRTVSDCDLRTQGYRSIII